MAILECVAANQQSQNATLFILNDAIRQFRLLSLIEQAKFINQLTVDQAQAVLAETPLGHVQVILEYLEDSGAELRARELSIAFGLMINASQSTQDYLKAGVFEHVKARLGWIVSLSLLGIFTGMIVASYEDALSALIILAIYMPVMADTGGNVGSQAATLLVRSLATGEVTVKDWLTILWKEFRVALIMAAALVAVILFRVIVFGNEASLPAGITLTDVGIAVSMAMVAQVITSTLIGSMLPIMARSMRLDPAVLVSPLLTSIVDITGLLIYFYTTTQLLGF